MELRVVADVGEAASGIPSLLVDLGLEVETARLPDRYEGDAAGPDRMDPAG